MQSILRPYISEAFISDKYHFIEEKIETDKGVIIQLILEGEFQRAETPNKNNRVYEEWLLDRETKKQQEIIKQRNGQPMGMDHPMPNPSDPPEIQAQMIQRIGMENACALNTVLEMHNKIVYGKSKVLQGDFGTGDKLSAFVKAKFKPAVSSRGLGGDPVVRSGYLYVPESYNQICYDFITNPSTHNAILERMISEEVYTMTHPSHTKKLWEVLINLEKKYE
jgi:hypothetical protein